MWFYCTVDKILIKSRGLPPKLLKESKMKNNVEVSELKKYSFSIIWTQYGFVIINLSLGYVIILGLFTK